MRGSAASGCRSRSRSTAATTARVSSRSVSGKPWSRYGRGTTATRSDSAGRLRARSRSATTRRALGSGSESSECTSAIARWIRPKRPSAPRQACATSSGPAPDSVKRSEPTGRPARNGTSTRLPAPGLGRGRPTASAVPSGAVSAESARGSGCGRGDEARAEEVMRRSCRRTASPWAPSLTVVGRISSSAPVEGGINVGVAGRPSSVAAPGKSPSTTTDRARSAPVSESRRSASGRADTLDP